MSIFTLFFRTCGFRSVLFSGSPMSHLSIIMDNIIDLRSHFTIFSETVEVTSGGLQKSAKFVAC